MGVASRLSHPSGLIRVNPTKSNRIIPKWVASDLSEEGRLAAKGLNRAEHPMLFVLWSFCVFLRLFRIIILGWIDNAGGGGLPSYARPLPSIPCRRLNLRTTERRS